MFNALDLPGLKLTNSSRGVFKCFTRLAHLQPRKDTKNILNRGFTFTNNRN